jgi:hypothetical protein
VIHWWRNRKHASAELAAARAAEAESQESVSQARDTYRDALERARAAQLINTRNHFSENLTKAFGG